MGPARKQGDVVFFDRSKNYGFIRNACGGSQRFLFAYKSIQCDPGTLSKAWAFVEQGGTPIPVTFCDSTVVENGAEDVAPLFGFEEPAIPLKDLREFMVIKAVRYCGRARYCAWATRPDGDEVFFHIEDVLEQYLDRWEFLKPGVPIYGGIAKSKSGKCTRATNVELYSLSELQKLEMDVVEDEPFNPAAKDLLQESDLLLPQNRTKTLFELIQERSHVAK